MQLFGRILFIAGFIGLGFQIEESWLGLVGVPIDSEHMTNAMLWWTACGAAAAGGVWLMKRYNPDK